MVLLKNQLKIHQDNMPLTKNVSKNISELYHDNHKKGKAKGANGKPRSKAQIIAIAYHAARKHK